jgi:hypothetical protein
LQRKETRTRQLFETQFQIKKTIDSAIGDCAQFSANQEEQIDFNGQKLCKII